MSGNGAMMDGLAIGNCTIKVRVEGEETRPALVLSHMLGADLTLWDDLVPEFVKHFRVVRYDTRGHGGSGLGDTPVTLARLGGDVLAILDELGIERAHFCGVSMGGAVGLWLLARAPARIERAVIAGGAAKLGEPAVWNARIASALADGMEQGVAPTIERWFSPAFLDRDSEPLEAVRALLRATSPVGYAACCAALRDMDLREAVRAVINPVLVLRGTDDPAATAEDARHLVEAMVNATAVELDARHCVSIEAEAAFAAAVVKFLTARSAPRRAAGRRPVAEAPKTRAAPAQAMPSVRRSGRSLVAARRPVARTAPVSGKAVAKASATRKTAVRATPPASSPRRAAAKPAARAPAPKAASRKETSPKAAALKPANTRAPGRAKASSGKTVQAVKSAHASSAHRAAPKTAGRAKASSAAALRAAATKAPKRRTVKKAASATAGKAGRAGTSRPVAKPFKAPIAKARAKPEPEPAKAANAKPVSRKTTSAKITSAKTTPAKTTAAKPPAPKPSASRRAAAPAPSRPAARDAPGSGRRKP